MPPKRYLPACLSGLAAGIFLGFLLPVLARHIGGAGSFDPSLLIILAATGAALGACLQRLLEWAHAPQPAPIWGGAAPFLPVLAATLLLMLPTDRLGVTGSSLGPVKHGLALIWVLSIGIYGFFLLKASLKAGHTRTVLAFTALGFLLLVNLSIQPPNESDEGDYVAAALALATNGNLRVDRVAASGELNRFYAGAMPPTWVHYTVLVEEHSLHNTYSYRMAGYPILLAPWAFLARLVPPPTRWMLLNIPGLIGYVLLISASLALARAAAGTGSDEPRVRSLSILALATLTPYLYYLGNPQPELWMAAAVAWSLLLWRRHILEKASVVPFALATTLALLLHERMAIFALTFFTWGLWRTRQRRKLILTTICCMIPVLISYASIAQFEWLRQMPHAYQEPFWNIARWLQAAIAHLFSLHIGVLSNMPPLAAGLVALPLLAQRDLRRKLPELVPACIAFALYFLLIITYPRTFDSWPHERYMIPALPLLATLTTLGFRRIASRGRSGVAVLWLLLGIQWALAWPYLSIPILWRWNPL